MCFYLIIWDYVVFKAKITMYSLIVVIYGGDFFRHSPDPKTSNPFSALPCSPLSFTPKTLVLFAHHHETLNLAPEREGQSGGTADKRR